MTRATFGCKVCGDFKKPSLGRWTSHQPHIVVMLSALTHFHGYGLDYMKGIYPSFQIRRLVCREHYVDAASSIAAAIEAHTGEFHQCGINMDEATTEASLAKLLPSDVLRAIKAIAAEISTSIPLTMRSIAHFVNDVLARHGLRGVRAVSSSQTSSANGLSRKRKVEFSDTSEFISKLKKDFIGEQFCENEAVTAESLPGSASDNNVDYEPYVDVTSLECTESEETSEVEADILNKYYSVQGHMLLKLFRYCPTCGHDLTSSNESVVRFTAIGTAPIVQFVCVRCSSTASPLQRWDGQPMRDK